MSLAKRRHNSVQSLIDLYTVVMGVALTYSVSSLIDQKAGLASVKLGPSMLFIAFSATLFPFFHGAIRHLHDQYSIGSQNTKAGALIVDFVLLFFHALAFVVLSLLLTNAAQFAWVLLAVLFIDVVWGAFVYFSTPKSSSLAPQTKWLLLNLLSVAVLLLYMVNRSKGLSDSDFALQLSVSLAIGCTVRTVIDYAWCRQLYFPE